MKTTTRYGLIAALVLLVSVPAIAQEGPPSQHEHVKGLEPFIGLWRGEYEGPDGQSGGLNVFCRWASNKSYAQFQFTSRSGDERTHMGTVIIGRDFGGDQIGMWAFWPDQQAHGKVSIGESTVSWKSMGKLQDGRESSADVTMTVSGDELKINVTNARRGDEARPDMNLTLKKRERQRD